MGVSTELKGKSRTGVRGVCEIKGRFYVYIAVNRKTTYVGCCTTIDEAAELRRRKEQELFGQVGPRLFPPPGRSPKKLNVGTTEQERLKYILNYAGVKSINALARELNVSTAQVRRMYEKALEGIASEE